VLGNSGASSKPTSGAQASSVTSTVPGLYRVRKSWTDKRTQIGAYSGLQNAKLACDNAGPGYYVFDSDGNAVYAYAGGSIENAG
jgi:hypothetical protein